MPDELAIGHAVRLAILNGLQTYQRLILALRAQTSTESGARKTIPVLYLLAKAVGMPEQSYAARHSMLAALVATASKGKDVVFGSPETCNLTRLFGMRTPRKYICICTKCVASDLDALGFTYYRRAHQLTGVDWCLEHGDRLKKIQSEEPFSKLPDYWDAQGLTEPLETCSETFEEASDYVVRYVKIMLSLSKRETPTTVNLANSMIIARARECGFRASLKGRKPLLSDQILAMAPNSWLVGNFPEELTAKIHNGYVWRIDSLAKSKRYAGSCESYALVLAALFDSSDLASKSFQSPPAEPEIARSAKAPKKLGKDFWNGHELYSIYVQSHGIHSGVAERLQIPHARASGMLTEVGLLSLWGRDSRPVWLAFRDFARGLSIEAACTQRGVDAEELEALLRMSSKRVSNALAEIDES